MRSCGRWTGHGRRGKAPCPSDRRDAAVMVTFSDSATHDVLAATDPGRASQRRARPYGCVGHPHALAWNIARPQDRVPLADREQRLRSSDASECSQVERWRTEPFGCRLYGRVAQGGRLVLVLAPVAELDADRRRRRRLPADDARSSGSRTVRRRPSPRHGAPWSRLGRYFATRQQGAIDEERPRPRGLTV